MCSRGSPASGTTSLVTGRPSVPWQIAHAAASFWASCAGAAQGMKRSPAKATVRLIGSPGVGAKSNSRARKKQKAARAAFCSFCRSLLLSLRSDRGGRLLLELEQDLVGLADVDRHLAAVLELAEKKLVGERPADGVLDKPRHRPRPHEGIEALLRQVLLEHLGEDRLDLLLGELLVELHQELLHHAHDDVVVERAERDDRVQPVAELGREHALDRFHLVADLLVERKAH